MTLFLKRVNKEMIETTKATANALILKLREMYKEKKDANTLEKLTYHENMSKQYRVLLQIEELEKGELEDGKTTDTSTEH